MSDISTPFSISCLFDSWREAAKELSVGRPVCFYSPRNYQDRRCAEEVLAELKATLGATVINFYIDTHLSGGRLDFSLLWRSVTRKTASKKRKLVQTRDDLYIAISQMVEESLTPFLFLISSSGVGLEPHQFELISLLHEVREELSEEARRRLLFLILDNYSLYYYENTRNARSSFFNLTRIHHWPLDETGLIAVLKNDALSGWIDPSITEIIGSSLFRATGGHVGLLVDLLDKVTAKRAPLPLEYWNTDKLQLLRQSAVLESIRRLLGTDPVGLVEVAMKYRERQFPVDASPNLQFLRHAGVVHWNDPFRAQLCPGLIAELVEELHKARTQGDQRDDNILGTVVREFGPRLYDVRKVNDLAQEAEFFVLHLSDLHARELFPFRFPGFENNNKQSLSGILAADLRAMGLIGKLNATVVSGDFTQTAKMDEFRRAREVLGDILAEIEVSKDKLILTAGNHDVTWNASPLLNKLEPISGVSLENYSTFKELLGLQPDPHVELTLLLSNSGKSVLRLLSLDSNFVEGPHAAGIGFISQAAMDRGEALLRLDNQKQREHGIDSVYTWLVIHHHVFPASALSIEDIKRPKLTVLANSSDVLAFCARVGVEVILHGHEHQPSVTVARRWPTGTGVDFKPIVSVGAGSIGAARAELGPIARNQYYVLYRMTDHIIIRSRWMGDNGLSFVPHNDLLIPLRSNVTPD